MPNTIDQATVHARDTSTSRPFRTLCGRARDEVRYVCSAAELLTLTTPPAPICPQCRFAIEKDAKKCVTCGKPDAEHSAEDRERCADMEAHYAGEQEAARRARGGRR